MNRYGFCLMLLLAHASPATAQPNGEPNDCNMGWAVWPRGDPRNPDVLCFPEGGRMSGVGSHYGETIWPLPDLNSDHIRDWAIHHSVDTLITKPNASREGPYEVLIYRGERGQLPDPLNYERVGPTEIGSVSWLVASGDWDNSGSTDLAVAIRIIGDTSFGNVGANVSTSALV